MSEGREAPIAVTLASPKPEKKQEVKLTIRRKDYDRIPSIEDTIELKRPHYVEINLDKLPEIELINLTEGVNSITDSFSSELPIPEDREDLTLEETEIIQSKIKKAVERTEIVADKWESKQGREEEFAQAILHSFKLTNTYLKGYVHYLGEPEIQEKALSVIRENWTRAKTTSKAWQDVNNFISEGEIRFTPLEEESHALKEFGGKEGDNNQTINNIKVPAGILSVILADLKSNSKTVGKERELPSAYWQLKFEINTQMHEGEPCLVLSCWDRAGGFPESMFKDDELIPGGTKRRGGTGQGYNTIRGLAELLGAKLEAGNYKGTFYDEEEKGALTRIYIPLKQGTPESDTLEI